MKKIIAFLLVVSLTAAIAIGGTLAYFTDRDSEANVFTVGDVKIDLNEEFDQGATLIPGVNIEKEATITNTGINDAYVWMTVAIPTALDNANASDNVVHWNVPGAFWEGYNKDAKYIQSAIDAGYLEAGSNGVADDKTWNVDDKVPMYETTFDGVAYNVYTLLYNSAVKPGETTNVGLSDIYMDTRVDIDPDGNWHFVENGVATDIDWNSNDDGNPVIYVSAYAIQTDGFASVEDAYNAYNAQWTTEDGVNNGLEWGAVPVEVSDSEGLATAISGGATNIVLKDGTYQMPAAAKGKTLTINGSVDAVIEVVPAGQGEANGQLDYSLDGSTVTFNGVTIKTNSQLYAGYARLSGIYNNCVIQNTYNLGTGNSEFNNCTFNITNEYLRVGGAYSAVFNGCTFNTDGRAILVFQDGTSVAQTVTVKDCTFNATAAANTWNGIHVAAVSIDGTNGTYTVNLEGTNTVDSDFNGLWQIKAGEANVTVNE